MLTQPVTHSRVNGAPTQAISNIFLGCIKHLTQSKCANDSTRLNDHQQNTQESIEKIHYLFEMKSQ